MHFSDTLVSGSLKTSGELATNGAQLSDHQTTRTLHNGGKRPRKFSQFMPM